MLSIRTPIFPGLWWPLDRVCVRGILNFIRLRIINNFAHLCQQAFWEGTFGTRNKVNHLKPKLYLTVGTRLLDSRAVIRAGIIIRLILVLDSLLSNPSAENTDQ
jgi:hypothetical protein